jgi:hypothetical protein
MSELDILEPLTRSGLRRMPSPDPAFRSLQAVVLIFFVLMDDSLLVFGALHRNESILPQRRSQTHRRFANMRFQPLQDEVTSLPSKNVRHSAAVRPTVSRSLLWPPPIYAHRLSAFEGRTIASRQANDHRRIKSSNQSTHVHLQ